MNHGALPTPITQAQERVGYFNTYQNTGQRDQPKRAGRELPSWSQDLMWRSQPGYKEQAGGVTGPSTGVARSGWLIGDLPNPTNSYHHSQCYDEPLVGAYL